MVAGGAENMSRSQYWLPGMRWGQRMNDAQVVDAMVGALSDPFDDCHMGVTAENIARQWQLTREEQDAFAASSQAKAVAAQAAGSYGCFAADHAATGLFLITPDIHYALHTHAAPEIYYCVSGSIDIQHGIENEPFRLTAGNYSVTPTGRVHSLTTNDEPVLLIYVWIEHMTEPIWIWRQDDDGTWHRESWQRAKGGAWRVANSEIVTPEEMAAAHQ